MPIQKFSNQNKDAVIRIRNKSTIRVVSALFSKGFSNGQYISLDLGFSGIPVSYTLPFNDPGTINQSKQNGLFFYQGNGVVFAIPLDANELIFKVREQKNFDFEFLLTYDFYPGGI